MLIDTHAHLNFNAYKDDIDEVIKRSLDNKVWMINVGSQYETSKKAVKIAEQYEKGVYASVGLHPIHLDTGLVKIKNDNEETQIKAREESFNYQKYKELAQSKKVVAIGEIGLDYYWKPKTTRKKEMFKQAQKNLLLKQLDLAKELDLPVIFHCRMAHNDLLEVLNQQLAHCSHTAISNQQFSGVIHCFTGTWEQAQEYMKMGFYLGFNGLIFKSDFDEIIRKTPLERILIETDCPYLSPPSHKDERNEPTYVKYIAQKIAQIKEFSYEEVAEKTTKNARFLFTPYNPESSGL